MTRTTAQDNQLIAQADKHREQALRLIQDANLEPAAIVHALLAIETRLDVIGGRLEDLCVSVESS